LFSCKEKLRVAAVKFLSREIPTPTTSGDFSRLQKYNRRKFACVCRQVTMQTVTLSTHLMRLIVMINVVLSVAEAAAVSTYL
jgi:hypothetical protein